MGDDNFDILMLPKDSFAACKRYQAGQKSAMVRGAHGQAIDEILKAMNHATHTFNTEAEQR